MRERLKNPKWQMFFYFFGTTVVTVGLTIIGWTYLIRLDPNFNSVLWIVITGVVILIGTFVGFFGARKVQRAVDVLHLGLKQIGKGNATVRIPIGAGDDFGAVYRDFNEMAHSVENKLKLLQKYGQASVLQEKQSSEAAVLEERKRLARDLHDTVSQQLFAMHMASSSLTKLLDINPASAKTVADQLVTMSQHAQKQLRSLIAQLRPLELEGRTLQGALEHWFPDYCRQNDLQGTLELQVKDGLSEPMEHQLFLIIQEGMANVVKHAKAPHVSLALYDQGTRIQLQLQDNGIGFEAGSGTKTSYGLVTMKERAQRLGGDAEIVSVPGAGTTIRIKIPKFMDEGSSQE